jgi:hypothetical protein
MIAVCSLFGVRYFVHKRPKTSGFNQEARIIFTSLDSASKRNLALYESAILRLADGSIKIIGASFEPELEARSEDNSRRTKLLFLEKERNKQTERENNSAQ